MFADHWPLAGLVLHTPRLQLRVPDPGRLAEVAELAAAGVHDPAVQPFAVEWTDAAPGQVVRNVLQFHWRTWAAWRPEEWSLVLVATADGRAIGTQSVDARHFAVVREVATGSWVGRREQGRGYGTEMRAAVLALAFAGLGARHATSEAFADNHASYAVSRKLGYVDDGIDHHLIRGVPVTGRRLRLDRAGWERARTVHVRIEGLQACRPMFGV
jgi:RimJ/RimL family protein N-acetyltransferase